VDLGPVGGVGQTAGAESVAQGEGHVIFFCDFQQLVEMLEQGVVLLVVGHPFDGERAAAGNHVHKAPFVFHPLHGRTGYAAMHGDEVHSIFCMLDNTGEDIVHGHIDDGLLLDPHRVQGSLIERDAADTGICLCDNCAADFIHRAAGGKVHDGVRAVFNGNPRFFQLFFHVGVIG